MIDVRIARRRSQVRRERQRRRLRRTMLVVGLLAVAVALLLVERSPLVAITRVDVSGTQLVAVDEVRRAAGIEVGTSLVRVDLDAARSAVQALPNVLRADVRRTDPLAVEIRVVERIPEFLAVQGDMEVVLDGSGAALSRSGPPGALTRIVVRDGPVPGPGGQAVPESALANVLATAREVPGPLGQRVDSWIARTRIQAVMVLDDGTRVEFGRAVDVRAKARLLAAVLEDLGDNRVRVINVESATSAGVTP